MSEPEGIAFVRTRWIVVFRPVPENKTGTVGYLARHSRSVASAASRDRQAAIIYRQKSYAKNARVRFRARNPSWMTDVDEVAVRYMMGAEPEILDEAPTRRVEV